MTTVQPVVQAPIPMADHPGLDPAVIQERIAAGRIAETHGGPEDPDVLAAGPPAYFQTYAQMRAELQSLAMAYPDLVRISDIGDGSEKAGGTADRDVLAVTLTSPARAEAEKPGVMWVAGQHAREIANPAMMMQWMRETLAGYGTDPAATALLDTREIHIVPMMNPDGHATVERGYARDRNGSLWQRKNTAPPHGVDLNRNWDFRWGGPGGSRWSRSQTYRGPSAASEPETRAIQDFAKAKMPGIFIDWHSYSELVLYPWGDTKDKAPDHVGLKAVAERFASYNHYSPIQSVNLYPTSGTSDDYIYGVLGIPAFGVETGRSFHQGEQEFARVWAENRPVLDYSARIADAPYERAQGPDAAAVAVDGATATLSAHLSDQLAGGQAIAAAEALLDPFAAPGSGVALTAADGAFDAPEEQVTGDVSSLLEAAAGARKLVYVRAQDEAGHWGPVAAQWLPTPASS